MMEDYSMTEEMLVAELAEAAQELGRLVLISPMELTAENRARAAELSDRLAALLSLSSATLGTNMH
jgi:hypothetical protein